MLHLITLLEHKHSHRFVFRDKFTESAVSILSEVFEFYYVQIFLLSEYLHFDVVPFLDMLQEAGKVGSCPFFRTNHFFTINIK